MSSNFTSKLVKMAAGNYRLDIETAYADYTHRGGLFCPSFNLCEDHGFWTMNGDTTIIPLMSQAHVDEAGNSTLKGGVSWIEYQIDKLLNPTLINVQDVSFHRNSGGFIIYEGTYIAKNGVKFPLYIQREPAALIAVATWTVRAMLPEGGELRADGLFAGQACWKVTEAIDALCKAQADALDRVAPQTPVEAPVTIMEAFQPLTVEIEPAIPLSALPCLYPPTYAPTLINVTEVSELESHYRYAIDRLSELAYKGDHNSKWFKFWHDNIKVLHDALVDAEQQRDRFISGLLAETGCTTLDGALPVIV